MKYCKKNLILVFQTFWKVGLCKQIAMECDMIFPKIWSYPFDRKWKMIFFKKYMEKSYIVQIFWKDGLFKKMHWNMIFLVLSGKIVFFLAKRWSSFFGRKLKDDLSEEIHENMILSLCTYRCHKHDIVPLSQKKSKIIFSCKNAPKGDWHSRLIL